MEFDMNAANIAMLEGNVAAARPLADMFSVQGKTAIVTGTESLAGTTVYAQDLRAGAALVIAGLAAEGTTLLENVHYVERGYENLAEKLSSLGARIRRIED